MFDALYVEDKDLTLEPYPVRRKALEEAIKQFIYRPENVLVDPLEDIK